jgi:hypothetical protein
MSKKSGFFYAMLSFIGFGGQLMKPIESPKYEDRPQPKGKRHRTFGKEITSFGVKPDYGHLKRKPFYQALVDKRRKKHEALVWELWEKGIIWTPTKLYWNKTV